jgi:hypothetical protein
MDDLMILQENMNRIKKSSLLFKNLKLLLINKNINKIVCF